MRIAAEILDFHKDPTFDPKVLLDERTAHPYVIKIKKHWWSRWEYVMDKETGCPKLYFSYGNAIERRIKAVQNWYCTNNCTGYDAQLNSCKYCIDREELRKVMEQPSEKKGEL